MQLACVPKNPSTYKCVVENLQKVGGFGLNYMCRRFCSHSPDGNNFNLAKDALEKQANKTPNKLALILSDGFKRRTELTYGQLLKSTIHLSTALKSLNSPPKFALVILPRIPAWWEVNLAGSWCGYITSPGISLLTSRDILYRFQESGADTIFCCRNLVHGVDEAEKQIGRKILKILVGCTKKEKIPNGWIHYEDLLIDGASRTPIPCNENLPDDICLVFFTSGTTGYPKMVPHTHFSYAQGHKLTAKLWLNLQEDDTIWNVSDNGWAMAAWSSLYTPLLSGSTIFAHQMPLFDSKKAIAALEDEGISIFCAPPTAYRMMVKEPLEKHSFKCLRQCVSGGEPLTPEVFRLWKAKTGLTIYEGYGQTETTLICATQPGTTVKPGSMGKPAYGYDVKIVDDDLHEVATGVEGQIAINIKTAFPPGLYKEYLKDPERTASSFRNGYYLTGDRGYLDDDGYLWFKARNDDVIISAGYRIGPFEVESALMEHPNVVEAAVVGVPDEIRGQIVRAFVVVTEDIAADIEDDAEAAELMVHTLKDHVKKLTAPYKCPKQIVLLRNLPKTFSGKVNRVELRDL